MKETVKILDLRSMPPFERHTKIFDTWNNLKEGQVLRIINDHDPKPLYYQFSVEHNGRFEWEYEKSGPKDWIVKIKKTIQEKGSKKEVKELIKQLHSGANIDEIKKRGKGILKNISPTDLALIEQEIIKEGVTREEMRKLCDVHLELMKDNLEKTDIKLKPGHPIHTFMGEHEVILDFIDKLQHVINSFKSAKKFSKVTKEIGILKHISEHLIEAEKHHQREEKALFPMLEKFGVTEPPAIMREEHKDLKSRKIVLDKIARENRKMTYSVFLKKVDEAAEYLIKELPNHIHKENNILYPMALQVIPEKEWIGIKEKCDEIGYCCFTPEN